MEIRLKLNSPFLADFSSASPIVISGPCSAECEEQVMTVARDLKAAGVHMFRAGIWKPRTRPNAFEGIGTEGLAWLRRVQDELGMLASTEVANAKHVQECLDHGIRTLWIGARTTANPFAVQEIADALQGQDVSVMVKNPVSPDVDLWIGALERLNKAGISHLAAIHRGFSAYGNTRYRNAPYWQLPIELRRRVPGLPVICDPSHIGGRRELIAELCQTAMDLNFEGLIIESHPTPDEAWSDAKQQITPQRLKEIISKLVVRKSDSQEKEASLMLDDLRSQIDNLDDELLNLLEARMKVASKIGEVKRDHNMTILQSSRWAELLEEKIRIGMYKGLADSFIQKVYTAIHDESIRHQKLVMYKNKQ